MEVWYHGTSADVFLAVSICAHAVTSYILNNVLCNLYHDQLINLVHSYMSNLINASQIRL